MLYKIKNIAGIDCIFCPMEDMNSITVQIMCKAGSIYEQKNNNGISHFLEHLFFKGGKKYPTPKAVAEAIDSFGGEFNAYTSTDHASYYVKCSPEFVWKAIDVLGDMMIHAAFGKDELEREKGVIIQEIMMYEDNPMVLVLDKRQQYYYGNNSYGWSTIGTKANVQSFTRDMLLEYQKDLYTKDNLIIIVAWKITNSKALEHQIEDIFHRLPKKRRIQKPPFPYHLPSKKQDFFDKKTEQNHLVFAAPGIDWRSDKKYTANILSIILGGNMSSRLFEHIREKQWLCYYIKAQHLANEDDGVFIIRAGIDKQRFEFGIKRIQEEITKLANGDISQKEFKNAIGYARGQLQMGIESSDEMASFVGTQYLIYKKIETIPEILKKYEAITKKDLQKMASLLTKQHLYLYRIQ